MNKYEKFQEELKAQKQSNYKELMNEVSSLKNRFEKLLSMAMNSSSARVERDYRVRSF